MMYFLLEGIFSYSHPDICVSYS